MVGVSSLIALLVGIPLAVMLVTSDKGGIYEAPGSTGRWARSSTCSARSRS
jgi:ABC-type methionine transport system permease subunit